MLNCIIIDDEELARALLKSYVDKLDFLTSKGEFENPLEALSLLKTEEIDIVFLDIQMPQLKGTDFAKLVPPQTRIIFTTAYSEYALDGFELSALDYLLKPITFARFLSAVEKFPKEKKQQDDDTLTIKSGYDLHKIRFKEILFIESDSEYVNYHLEDGKKIMSNQSLSKLVAILPSYFLRVHRSYIVNKQKVASLKGRDLLVQEHKIPVSDSYYDIVKKEMF